MIVFKLLIAILISYFSLFNVRAFTQSTHTENATGLKNVVVVSFGYTHVPNGSEVHSKEENGFNVPTLGLDYIRKVNNHLQVGIMFDYELDHYLIIQKELERENAFIAVAGLGYSAIKHLLFFTGAGVELEKNKHLFVFRLGAEYGLHMNEHWLLAPSFFFDWKENYDTYSMALGLGYNF